MSRRKDVRIPNPHRAANEEQNLQNKRLKSLYDAIDAGRNKDSIELADKIVRKFGGKDRNNLNDKITVNTAQALKALASIRLENSFTADAAVLVENCEQAITSGEFNEGTLQESYIPNRIPLLIERILKVQKPTEGLLLDLYFGYARVMDFKNQQRVANMLYKDYENWKYLFWVINNIVMQANNSPLAQKVYYPLAQRMLEKLAVDGGDRKPNRTEIVLNHQVLTQRRDYQKAFDYLNRVTANGSLSKEDAKTMRFELLKLSERFDDLFAFIAEEVKTDALNFGAWETLFWIYEHANNKQDEELKNRALEQFDQLNREFLPDTNKNAKHYGYLLKLLFYKQINKLNDSEKSKELTKTLGNVVDNLKKMISLTHERPNSYADISKFLHMLPTSEHAQLVEFINTEFSGQLEDNSDLFYIRELLQTAFGFHRQKSVSERTQYALKLVGSLNSNAENDTHLDQHAKSVTLIISNVFWDNYIETGSNQHLYELTALLEFIFDRCPNVFIAALVLMRIYTKIGGINRIVALYNQLDIKFFQRDSLGYLTFASAMQFGRFREAIFYLLDSRPNLITTKERQVKQSSPQTGHAVWIKFNIWLNSQNTVDHQFMQPEPTY
ncbi:hypothetical protein M3Y97_00465100 [Aphelenchoides bicaudatus]|nr:hypothetical protein M3Y97_00465100 [Aphelenchoides bicaudatus]